MMDVREKLVELLDNAIIDSDDNYGFPNTKQVAEHLIANGVTVQEWISVKDKLPTSDRNVLVFVRGYVEIGWYDGYHDEWRTGIVTLDNCEVTHWMPLPQPPKGE